MRNTTLIHQISLCFLSFLLISCAFEQNSKKTMYTVLKATQIQLTDKDIFDEELDKEITDYDIQEAAYHAKKGFRVPLKSSIILAQSGAQVPDAYMQSALSNYYNVSVYNGFSKTKNSSNRRKDKEQLVNNNYMKLLRLIAAKGGQNTIIIYWGTIEKGDLDEKTNIVKWSQYEGGKLSSKTKALRYLLKFTLVDVTTGNWSSYSPVNIEINYVPHKIGSNITDALQIDELMKKSYDNAALLLSEKYKYKTK